MNSIKNKLVHLFNFGASPYRLDSFRFAFSIFTLFMFLTLHWENYADIPDCVWAAPGTSKIFLNQSLSLHTIVLLKYTFIISILSLAFGFFSRISALMSAATLYLLLSNSISAFYYDRSGNQIVICLFVLSLSPTLGSHFSVDRLLFEKKQFKSKDFIWPLRLIEFLFFSTFFVAGLSKILNSGLAWTDGENIMAKWIWAGTAFKSNTIFDLQNSTHLYMITQPILAKLAGPFVLLLELSSLLFFISKKQWVGAVLFALFQISVFFTMFISFNLFIPLYAVFIPWERFIAKSLQIRNRIFFS